jgi:hypothetical protein
MGVESITFMVAGDLEQGNIGQLEISIPLVIQSRKKIQIFYVFEFQNRWGVSTELKKLKDGIIRCGLFSWEFDIFGLAETNAD